MASPVVLGVGKGVGVVFQEVSSLVSVYKHKLFLCRQLTPADTYQLNGKIENQITVPSRFEA